MLQVTPMDAQGNFNFGPNSSHQIEVLRRAKTIIVEVNENMPYCYGVNNSIHVSQVTRIVEGSNPAMATLPPAKVTEVDQKNQRQHPAADSRWRHIAARHWRPAQHHWQA